MAGYTVFALGGSVISSSFSSLDEVAEAVEQNSPLVAVTGAGDLKKHQEAVKGSVNKAEADLVGIAATRLNARTLESLMQDSYPGIPRTVQEVREAASTGRNIAMGGLNPGFSTDAVAAVVAELLDAELYVATDVDGIYTGDPGEEGSEKLDRVNTSRLQEMVSGENEPGKYAVIDGTAVQIIERSGIDTKVLRGTPENLEDPAGAEGTVVES